MTQAVAPAGHPGAARPRRREGRRIATLVPPLVLVVAWELAATFDVASDRLLPGPGEVVSSSWELLNRGYFYENLLVTLRVVGISMAISVVVGVLLAAAIGTMPVVRDGVYPFVVALNIVPKVALVPLLTITLGSNARSRVIIVVLVAFFPVFLNTLTAIRDADADRARLMRSLGASRRQRLRMHLLPEGAPTILAGVKLSLTIAFIATILAEFLIRRDGLGYLITSFQVSLNTPMMFATTATVAGLGMVFFLVIERVERRLVFWEHGGDAGGGS